MKHETLWLIFPGIGFTLSTIVLLAGR